MSICGIASIGGSFKDGLVGISEISGKEEVDCDCFVVDESFVVIESLVVGKGGIEAVGLTKFALSELTRFGC